MKKFDVAIVGCGPIGAVIANILGSEKLSICIIEKENTIYDKPRAIVLDWEAMRTLQYCGVAHELSASIKPHPGTDYIGVNGEIIKLFDPQPPPYELGWPSTFTFIQPQLEKLLRASMSKKKNIQFFSGYELSNLFQNKREVGIRLNNISDNKKLEIVADYLIGCDGARSSVRSILKINMEDHGFDESWIVVDAHLIKETNLPKKTTQYCWPSRPATYVVGPGNLRRWEIKILPKENKKYFDDQENVIEVLKNYVDVSALDIWRSATYRHKVVVAKDWRKRRVFLAGDSAHQTPPFLGQGLCTGMRDAFNISWKLAHIKNYGFKKSILSSYQSERKPHATKIIKYAKDFGLIIGEMDIDAAKKRDKKLRKQLLKGHMETTRQKFIPDLKTGMIFKDNMDKNNSNLAGTLFVQPKIKKPRGNAILFDDYLPMRFLFITNGVKYQKWMESYSGDWSEMGGIRINIQNEKTLTKFQTDSEIEDLIEVGNIFSNWAMKYNIKAVIVRPDRYIYSKIENEDSFAKIFLSIKEFTI